ncbi:MAG: acyl-CoA dehydrogenase C-terminal domain-containing protein, partial [Halioglobus sp.]|nr:acyl-CoA dehydrogenase C-terminal domain-containing protein [Halioglobus sp.]
MPAYRAPLRDIRFVVYELLEGERHYRSLHGCETLTPELFEAIVDSAARFAENVVAPLNRSGDEQGCRYRDGRVTTPDGFKAAFAEYARGGWQALSVPTAQGGQGLPASCSTAVSELMGSANYAWSMIGGLAHAPISLLLAAGSDRQKSLFLPRLLSGDWAGTMCLTEPQCGSDVGLIRTRARRNPDGSYAITGTKIFISGGEQDITENIIHTVLARVEGAPGGTAGISLFVVPKILVDEHGNPGAANTLSCGAIENKMGLKGSPTCVMNFDGATGFLLGEENGGLDIMFRLMNTARLGTALQGVSMGEAAFQGALDYARERLQMRSLSGPKNPQGPADPIIVHPDVRRMLLTQKALTEGSRALVYWLAQLVDASRHGPEQEAAQAEALLSLLTPIAKAFCTEAGFEVTSLGVQVFGGHGYIREHGMEQLLRDSRIAMLYEGTTGIQSLDLLGRKVMGSQGKLLAHVTGVIHRFCKTHDGNAAMTEFIEPLSAHNRQWGELTTVIGTRAMRDPEEIGAASVDYTLYAGYVVLAYLWARMARVALQAVEQDNGPEEGFYRAKLTTARFYYARLLPRATA